MGLIDERIYYTYNDVTIVPTVVSDIKHRSECEPWNEEGMLPLFTAPMDTVVSESNFNLFEENHINAILPRTAPLDTRKYYSIKGKWAAYSLNEFSEVFCNEDDKLPTTHKLKALIDVANGHMKIIFDLADKAKKIYGDDLLLMGGNIANPKTYEEYARHGFWGVRCSVGTGKGCLSTSNTGIHMPIASLINDIAKLKKEIDDDYRSLPYIIADGGIRGYSDVIKALALGSDYVMIGSVFAKMVESAAPKICEGFDRDNDYAIPFKIDFSFVHDVYKKDGTFYGSYKGKEIWLGDIEATFYGMASREGQIAMNGEKTKTSEGVKKLLKVEYTMEGWTRNFIDYLRSAMSYVGAKNLHQFRNSKLIINSQNAVNAVNK